MALVYRILLLAMLTTVSVTIPLPARSQPATNASNHGPVGSQGLTNALPGPVLPTNPPGRYLFIVGTSMAMRPRAAAVQKALDNLLQSSLHGQLQGGETVGLWTYDENLHAGQFPLQHWTPELSTHVASNVLAYLRAQRYTGASHFERVWPTLTQVVRQSERLTILLVTDGSERITGTPFDREINGYLRQESQKQLKAREPFITVLRTQRGAFVGCSLNSAPWPVEFPGFPPLPLKVEAPKPNPTPAPAPKKEMPPMGRPLILRGDALETNLPTPTAPALATNTTGTTTSAPVPLRPEPAPVASATAPAGLSNTMAAAKPTEVEPAAVPQPGLAAAQPAKAEPVIPSAAKPAEAMPAAEARPDKEPLVNPATVLPAAATSTSPPVQNATATPNPAVGWPLGIIAAGGGGVVLVGAFVFLLLRRSRGTPHASLITRSMDKDQK